MTSLRAPTRTEIMLAAIDLADPVLGVQLMISPDEDRLWVNVDGICILRIQGIKPGTFELEKDD